MYLKQKAALITGGARIGQAVSADLARQGCDVAVTFRTSRQAAESSVRRAKDLGVKAVAICADLRRSADQRKTMKAVWRAFGRLDILVNMASVYDIVPIERLMKKGDTFWKNNIDVNLNSVYELSLKASVLMKKSGGGRIINFSDWVAASGRPRYRGYLPYYVSKMGVKGLTESLALELAPNILVNAVAPGPILPPPNLSKAGRAEVAKVTPLRRWGGPEEIAKAVRFLIETDYVTGECLRVDGGRHLY